MSKTILVPLDGSALADRILVLARLLLVQDDTEVVLVRIVPETARRANDPILVDAKTQLTARRDELSRQGGRARFEIVAGRDAAEEILRFAGELGPSLIITSTHGETSSSRAIRGSVAERILQKTEHPVLLANPLVLGGAKVAPLTFRKILVPLDGSELGTKVLPLVRNVARLCGSEVVLLHAVHKDATGLSPESMEAAEGVLHQHQGKHLEDVKVRRRVAEGNPANVILDAVAEEKPDLVAFTTHGQSGASKWQFGSTAEQIIRQCTAPLLVYRTAGFSARPKG